MDILKKSHQDPALPKSTFFHIGQDKRERLNRPYTNIYKSTIKDDYPAVQLVTKQSRVPSPEQAKVFTVDRRINEQKSLTATHFGPQGPTERTTLSEVAKLGLGTKNLTKMDVDDRAMSFDTTHKVYFPPRVSEKVKGRNMCNTSYIPEGRILDFCFLYAVETVKQDTLTLRCPPNRGVRLKGFEKKLQ